MGDPTLYQHKVIPFTRHQMLSKQASKNTTVSFACLLGTRGNVYSNCFLENLASPGDNNTRSFLINLFLIMSETVSYVLDTPVAASGTLNINTKV